VAKEVRRHAKGISSRRPPVITIVEKGNWRPDAQLRPGALAAVELPCRSGVRAVKGEYPLHEAVTHAKYQATTPGPPRILSSWLVSWRPSAF
jgi:hypothetical protein